jgi:hypothetical protein
LFFTKRDWTGWGTNENEVEGGFDYTQPALVQKDYSGDRNNFINLSEAGDITSFAGAPYNTEIYGQYTIGISTTLTNGIQQFNRFSIVNPTTLILPVTITNLKAYQKDNGVQIDWTALNELNIDHYGVERSISGTSFTEIGSIDAQNKGTSVNYSKIDPSPVGGNNFYRVKVVDKNGALIYSPIAKVYICCDKAAINIYPNPVVNRWYNIQFLNMPKGKYQLIMYNSVGQQVLVKTIDYVAGPDVQHIQLPSSIGRGTYFVKIFNASVNSVVTLIIE